MSRAAPAQLYCVRRGFNFYITVACRAIPFPVGWGEEEDGRQWNLTGKIRTGRVAGRICCYGDVGACSRDIPVIMGAAERLGKWNLIFADFRRGIFWDDRFRSAIRSSDYLRKQFAPGPRSLGRNRAAHEMLPGT